MLPHGGKMLVEKSHKEKFRAIGTKEFTVFVCVAYLRHANASFLNCFLPIFYPYGILKPKLRQQVVYSFIISPLPLMSVFISAGSPL